VGVNFEFYSGIRKSFSFFVHPSFNFLEVFVE